MLKRAHGSGRSSFLAGTFLSIDSAVTQIAKANAAIHQGLWLGLLDRAALQQVTAAAYASSPTYADTRHNLSGLEDWERRAVDRYFGGCRSVLVGGAGGGREVVALSRRGIRADAFDPSPNLMRSCVELLKVEGIRAEAVVSPPDQVPQSFGVYDGLIVGWVAYTHIVGRDARIEFLRQFRRHVRSGGPILLSFWFREGEERQLRWIRGIARSLRRLRRSRDPVEMGDVLVRFFAHRFTEDEIRRELEAAGFRVEYFATDHCAHAVGIAEAVR